MFKSCKKNIYLILFINIFLILFNILILLIAKKSSFLVESFYSRKLFFYINKPLSYISNYFSFSLGELAVAAAIITLIFLFLIFIYFIIILIKQKLK